MSSIDKALAAAEHARHRLNQQKKAPIPGMTPAARLQAVIEILEEIDATPRPADTLSGLYFRSRRYIGAKDRNAIAERLFGILRRRHRLTWCLERSGHTPDARSLVIAEQMLIDGRPADSIATAFDGERFNPSSFNAAERVLVRALDGQRFDEAVMPRRVRFECPDWAEPLLQAALGANLEAELEALLRGAPMDLRANAVKTTRDKALQALAAEHIQAEPTRFAPLGMRVHGRPAISTLKLFNDGLVEIQDEGSQLVALVADCRPGQQVVDFCAGAGGKTLAMAAAMANKGRVVACDVLENRLKRAAERFRRAGLHNIETRPLASERDPWVKRHKQSFDRVLVDAPCTGTGTWRRNPDQRWRQLGPGLSQLLPLQGEILASAARLVRPGGRVIYATCSLLLEENEHQIDAFLAAHPDFRVLPLAELWPAVGGAGAPPCPGAYLRLTPAQHDTDGFFAAVLERVAAPQGD